MNSEFDSAIDRAWDELDLLEQNIVNLEAELNATKGAKAREWLQKKLAEARAKREEKSEYLKGFYQ